MNSRDKILKYLKYKGSASGKELAERLGVSRQALNKHLKILIQDGRVTKLGSTRGATYSMGGGQKISRFGKSYLLKGLSEDIVFREFDMNLALRKALRKNVFEIANYAFTEIVNNAIEHSHSENCHIEMQVDPYIYFFRVRDFGIGIFFSISDKFHLPDETSAIGELIKGKTTTMKETHTGEGIFFTSKSGDEMFIRSHKNTVTFDNIQKDIFVGERKFVRGTEVTFSINRRSRKKLDAVFMQYAPEEFDFQFGKTKVFVKLFQREYISRSEARRLLVGLDKFKEIILDFTGVKSLGQGFADDVFRVFQKRNPGIFIKVENISPALQQIIAHVVDNNN